MENALLPDPRTPFPLWKMLALEGIHCECLSWSCQAGRGRRRREKVNESYQFQPSQVSYHKWCAVYLYCMYDMLICCNDSTPWNKHGTHFNRLHVGRLCALRKDARADHAVDHLWSQRWFGCHQVGEGLGERLTGVSGENSLLGPKKWEGFVMFHLKKRRSKFLFFVSTSLQVQHRSCNLHAVFLGLEGRRTNTFGIWFWRFQQSQVVKKSILPKLSHWHYHWYFLSDCFSKALFFFFLKGSHGKKVNLFANKRTQKSQEGGLEVIRCTDAPNPAPLDRISLWRIPAIHSMIH